MEGSSGFQYKFEQGEEDVRAGAWVVVDETSLNACCAALLSTRRSMLYLVLLDVFPFEEMNVS